MQTSILRPVSCYGIGVHSGKIIHLTLKPAKKDTGIVFIRTDVNDWINIIQASYANVIDTSLSTSVANDHKVQVSTIEHLMAAIWGCGIDNMIVELDGPEVPIMDGSSKPFIFMIECAGRKIQNAQKKCLKILKEVQVSQKDSIIFVKPSEAFAIDLTVDYTSKAIGKQNFCLSSNAVFKDEISSARTFGFIHELEYLKSRGLAQGASLENAIGIDQDKVLNSEGLRFEDEFVRHKMLDFIGDLFTAQGNIYGSFSAYKTSHAINNEFLRQLFSDQSAYQWVSVI